VIVAVGVNSNGRRNRDAVHGSSSRYRGGATIDSGNLAAATAARLQRSGRGFESKMMQGRSRREWLKRAGTGARFGFSGQAWRASRRAQETLRDGPRKTRQWCLKDISGGKTSSNPGIMSNGSGDPWASSKESVHAAD
jgi:hypothetical protein